MMEIKSIFAIVAVILLAQRLLRLLWSQRVAVKHMTPAEILRWRLINREIDPSEYQVRMRKLHNMIGSALRKRVVP